MFSKHLLNHKTALELLKAARADIFNPEPRLVLHDWLYDFGTKESLILANVLNLSFNSNQLVKITENPENFYPIVGAINGWFHGNQPDNTDEALRLWLMAPYSFEIAENIWMEMMPINPGKFIIGRNNDVVHFKGYKQIDLIDEDWDDEINPLEISQQIEQREISNELLVQLLPPEDRHDAIQHTVTITKPFLIGKYPITQRQWGPVMKLDATKYGSFSGLDLPVEQMSWEHLDHFCNQLRINTELKIQIPTEAQWEYACRAGTTTAYNYGNQADGSEFNCMGFNKWTKKSLSFGCEKPGHFLDKTSIVGSYESNAWGLFDMHGNVSEWCSDFYEPYPFEDAIDPTGPSTGDEKVLRGGNYRTIPFFCCSFSRFHGKTWSKHRRKAIGRGGRIVIQCE